MKVVNKDVEEGETKIVNSRYSIVMATSKRARQLIAWRPSACRCERGRETIVDRNRRIEQRRVEDQSRECGRRRVKTMRQNQTVSAFFMLADESCHIKVQK